MTFFVWHRTRLPRLRTRRKNDRVRWVSGQALAFSVRVVGLTKTQAEDLLDWLEATGHGRRKLTFTDGEGFSVFYS